MWWGQWRARDNDGYEIRWKYRLHGGSIELIAWQSRPLTGQAELEVELATPRPVAEVKLPGSTPGV